MVELEFREGLFRVVVCENGHVTLQVLDGDSVRFVATMSQVEAAELAADLMDAAAGPVC